MAQLAAINGAVKKVVRVVIVSDSVCPWCFVGKRNLDNAISLSKDKFDFEIKWQPFFLNAAASKEGVVKRDYFLQRFGSRQSNQTNATMIEMFRGLGLEYDLDGLIGNTLDSHRLVYFAGQQGLDKQHSLMEELFVGYFTQGKYIGDRGFLVESAEKVGVVGAAEFLDDPNNGVKEVNEEVSKYSAQISGVPYILINNEYELSGGQPPEAFLRAFELATK